MAANERVGGFSTAVGVEAGATAPSPSPSPGQQINHYRILSLLGAGGMGEVWLAEDTRLGRKVAIKLLPAKFTQSAGRVRRFEQEARAASALNHPNIITIHELGQTDAWRYIVMEMVGGRLNRGPGRGKPAPTLLTERSLAGVNIGAPPSFPSVPFFRLWRDPSLPAPEPRKDQPRAFV